MYLKNHLKKIWGDDLHKYILIDLPKYVQSILFLIQSTELFTLNTTKIQMQQKKNYNCIIVVKHRDLLYTIIKYNSV